MVVKGTKSEARRLIAEKVGNEFHPTWTLAIPSESTPEMGNFTNTQSTSSSYETKTFKGQGRHGANRGESKPMKSHQFIHVM